jgi:hypothetical protein
MSLYCGTSHIAAIFIILVFTINVGHSTADVAAAIVGGWGFPIKRGVWY